MRKMAMGRRWQIERKDLRDEWPVIHWMVGYEKVAMIHRWLVSGSQQRQSDRNAIFMCKLCVFREIFICFRVKGCKWISAWEAKETEKGDFVAVCTECPLTGKYCIIIILFSGTCSNSLFFFYAHFLCLSPIPFQLNLIIACSYGNTSQWTNCSASNCTKGRKWPLVCLGM